MKLCLYPNGNKEKGVKDHISLYLETTNAGSLPSGWEVIADMKVYLLTQNKKKYVTIEGMPLSIMANLVATLHVKFCTVVRHFHALKTERGFSRLIPLATFNDPSNGYLIDDTCVFGVDVSVVNNTPKGECLSMVNDPIPFKHTWRIADFSQLTEYVHSHVFEVGGYKWYINMSIVVIYFSLIQQ